MTYLTMFNVNSIVQLCGTVYDTRKKNIVSAMKADRNEAWKQRGKRFEVFRPKHENPEPSEWYITLYMLLRPTILLGLSRRNDRNAFESGTKRDPYSILSFTTLWNVFRKRQRKPQEPERPEEGWVL